MKQTKLIALILLGLWCSAHSVFATQQVVEDVELRGYRIVTREALIQVIKTRVGEAYDATQVKHDLAQIMAMGYFDQVHSRAVTDDGPRGGKVVIFDLKELPQKR